MILTVHCSKIINYTLFSIFYTTVWLSLTYSSNINTTYKIHNKLKYVFTSSIYPSFRHGLLNRAYLTDWKLGLNIVIFKGLSVFSVSRVYYMIVQVFSTEMLDWIYWMGQLLHSNKFEYCWLGCPILFMYFHLHQMHVKFWWDNL